MRVINPATGKPFENKVTVGNMYMLKLLHKVDEKDSGEELRYR